MVNSAYQWAVFARGPRSGYLPWFFVHQVIARRVPLFEVLIQVLLLSECWSFFTPKDKQSFDIATLLKTCQGLFRF